MNNRGIELVNVAPYMKEKTKLKELAEKAEVPTDKAERLITQMVNDKNGHKRQPKPPVPEGGISIRAAGRKYGLIQSTISRWVQRGLIPIVLLTRNEKYIDEKRLAELARLYKKEPGQGKLTIKQTLNSA